MAGTVGLAEAVHLCAVRQPAGTAVPGRPDAYPGRDEVVEYLTSYAEHFDLPVELGSEVLAVRPGERRLRGGDP